MICHRNIACLIEYNIKRHYNSQHSKNYDEILGQLRVDKANKLKKSMQVQQKMMLTYKDDSELASIQSFKLSEAIAEKGKALSDGEFIKHCLFIFSELACPEKKYLIEQTSLSRYTVARRIDTMASHLEDCLVENINKFSHFSSALDESTDINDTAQLAVYIRGVTNKFEVKEEFLDLCSMKSRTTGEEITKEVLKVSEKFRLDPKKL